MDSYAPLLVGLVCCVLPILSHTAVYVVARRGSPVSIRYNWRDSQEDQ